MDTGKNDHLTVHDAGPYMVELRKKHDISQAQAAKVFDISKSYMNEIEKGIKCPSDAVIRNIAEFFEIDESDLFKRFGKTPLLARELFEEMPGLQDVLAKIRSNPNLTDDQRQKFLDSVERTYKELFESTED